MRRIILIVFLVSVSLFSFAQNWQPGYFDDVRGNRVGGFILSHPPGKGPIKGEGFILYKQSEDADEIKLSASDVKWYVAGKDSFVVAHPPMGQTWAKNEYDFVKVVLDEPVKLYAYNSSSRGGSPVHISPGLGLGFGTGGSYAGGGIGLSFGGGGGGGRSKAVYYFGASPAELTMLDVNNFEDVMSDIMGDEPEVVEQIKNHRYSVGNIEKLIRNFKQAEAAHADGK